MRLFRRQSDEDAITPLLRAGEHLVDDDDLPARYSGLVWTEEDDKHRFNCWNYVTDHRIVCVRVHGGDVFHEIALSDVVELGYLDTNTVRIQVHQTHGVVEFWDIRVRPAVDTRKLVEKIERRQGERAGADPGPTISDAPPPNVDGV